MGQPTATIDVGSDGIAVVTLQNPPVNALHPAGVCTGIQAANPWRILKLSGCKALKTNLVTCTAFSLLLAASGTFACTNVMSRCSFCCRAHNYTPVCRCLVFCSFVMVVPLLYNSSTLLEEPILSSCGCMWVVI